MPKVTQLFAGVLALFTLSSPVMADWKQFWQDVHVGFQRNNAWPHPFQEADAAQVNEPFEIMKSNGWRLHNTIGHDLFRAGDGSLLSAGQRRVHWIATQAPHSRRKVFVMQAGTQEETQSRISSVRSALQAMGAQPEAVHVFVTDMAPPTVSGSWATRINREWLDHMATPKLPDQSTTGQPGASSSATAR
nr:hypothetical protein [Rubripirellula sp.]